MAKKYKYNVSLLAEDFCDGIIELTKKEAEIVAYATDVNNWKNKDGNRCCASFWIDIDNPMEITDQE